MRALNQLRNDHPAKKRWVGLVRCAPRPFAGRYEKRVFNKFIDNGVLSCNV